MTKRFSFELRSPKRGGFSNEWQQSPVMRSQSPRVDHAIWTSTVGPESKCALFLATKLMRAHHISSILWEVDLIDCHIGAPYLSMPRRQSMLLVFWVCTLRPFCRIECRWIFPRKSAKHFSNAQSQTRSKSQKKIACAAKIYLCFKIKNLHDVHQIFDQSTLEMVTYVFLPVECTKYVQTMQNQFLISLFLKGK